MQQDYQVSGMVQDVMDEPVKGPASLPANPESKTSKNKILNALTSEAFAFGKQGKWAEATSKWEEIIAFAKANGLYRQKFHDELFRAKRVLTLPTTTKASSADKIESFLSSSNPSFGIRTVNKTLEMLSKGKDADSSNVDQMLFHAACGCAKWHDVMLARKGDKQEIIRVAKQQPVSKVVAWLRKETTNEE